MASWNARTWAFPPRLQRLNASSAISRWKRRVGKVIAEGIGVCGVKSEFESLGWVEHAKYVSGAGSCAIVPLVGMRYRRGEKKKRKEINIETYMVFVCS